MIKDKSSFIQRISALSFSAKLNHEQTIKEYFTLIRLSWCFSCGRAAWTSSVSVPHGNVFYAARFKSVQTCSISFSHFYIFMSCFPSVTSQMDWSHKLAAELRPERSRMCPDLPDQTRWRQRVYKCSEESCPSATNHSVSTHFTPQTCSLLSGCFLMAQEM